MTDFLLRKTNSDDINVITSLLQTCYPVLMSSVYQKSILDRALPLMCEANTALLISERYFLVETEEGEVIGCGGWSFEQPGEGCIKKGTAHIRHFATHPNWINKGVAKQIYQHCENQAIKEGVGCFECYSSLNAEPFYKAMGFERIKDIEIPLTPTDLFPAIWMKHSLI